MKKLVFAVVFFVLVFGFLGVVLAEEESMLSNLSDENESVLEDLEENDDNLIVISSGEKYKRELIFTNSTKNPDVASVHCENKGYTPETRKDTTGKEYTACVFPDGKECLTLEFLRGKCGKEYANISKEDLARVIVTGTNLKLKEGKCDEGCSLKVGDSMIILSRIDDERMGVVSENTSAATDLNLTVEEIDGKVMLRAYLSNGRWALVKYLPESASDKAAEELGEKCSERGCVIELKEIKVDQKEKLAYEVGTSKEVKILGFIKKEMSMTAQIDAETGQIIDVKKPFWAFLAK